MNLGGLLYEDIVRSAVQNYCESSPTLQIQEDHTGAFNSHVSDLRLVYGGQSTDIEIKKENAQMGEGSFLYANGVFRPANDKFDSWIFEFLNRKVLTKLILDIEELLSFIRSSKVDYNRSAIGFPVNVTTNTWEAAVEKGLVRRVQGIVSLDQSVIENHYNKKGVFYIQIEGSGLFYMGSNPLNLPIPELIGDVNIEIRPKRSGSRTIKNLEDRVCSVGLISTGRIVKIPKSPFTLDNTESVKELFNVVC